MLADMQVHEGSRFSTEESDVAFQNKPQLPWYYPYKIAVEWLLAIVLLLVTAPLLLLAAVLIKLSSPGPIIYSQVRLGRRGRPYRIFKIRTMVHDCEKTSGAMWSTPHDSR